MVQLDKERALAIVKAAIREDIGKGDITTSALIDKYRSVNAAIKTREDCVVCGLRLAEWAIGQLDYSVRFKPNCSDGDCVGAGKELAFIEARAATVLKAERVMLNFIGFLSGIATNTKKYVDIAAPYGVRILDTRKTVPLMRYLQKYAVSAGGGTSHRMGLYDAVLIKDNHIALARGERGVPGKGKKTLRAIVEEARKKNARGVKVEIEVTDLDGFSDALEGKPDIIMLDNMRPDMIRACMEIRKLSRIKPLLEASGGITLINLEEYAATKVDMISIGALTSSVEDIDVTLDIV